MANKIWVKVAHPTAQFYQEVLDDKGELVIEHVRAHTDASGRQVARPMLVTQTGRLRQALGETLPGPRAQGQHVPSRLIECDDKEIEDFLGDIEDERLEARQRAAVEARQRGRGRPVKGATDDESAAGSADAEGEA